MSTTKVCLPPNVSLLWVFSTLILLYCLLAPSCVTWRGPESSTAGVPNSQLIYRSSTGHQAYLTGPQPVPGISSLGNDQGGVVPAAVRAATADSAPLPAHPEGTSQKEGGGDQAALIVLVMATSLGLPGMARTLWVAHITIWLKGPCEPSSPSSFIVC